MPIEFENRPVLARRFAAICAVAAIAWGVGAVTAARQVDYGGDDGPPMGALFVAGPAFALLVIAGIAWSRPFRKPRSRSSGQGKP